MRKEEKRMGEFLIDFPVMKDCVNPYSFGMICVQCNACGRFDKTTQKEAQLRLYRELLEDRLNFQYWADNEELRAIQEKNIASDIEYCRKKIQELERDIEKKDEEGSGNDA